MRHSPLNAALYVFETSGEYVLNDDCIVIKTHSDCV